MKFFNNVITHFLLIILVALGIFIKAYTNEGFPMWADNILPVLNMQSFNDLSNSTYAERNAGLVYNPIFVSFYFIVDKLFVFINSFHVTLKLLSFLWIFLPYLFLYLTVYVCFKILLKNNNAALLLTFFYIFSQLNYSWVTAGWNITTLSHAGSLLFFALFIRYTEKPTTNGLLALCLFGSIGIINIAYFYAIGVVCAIYFCFYVFLSKFSLKYIVTRYKLLVLLPVIFFCINSYWILPTPVMQTPSETQNSFKNIYPSNDLNPSNSWNYITVLQSFSEYKDVFKLFNSPAYQILFLTFTLVVLYQVIKNNKNVNSLSLLGTYIITFALTIGKNMPVIWDLFGLMPGAFMIRSPQLKFFSALFFILSYLAGLLIIQNRNALTKILIFILISFGAYGFVKGNIFNYWTGVNPTPDYQKVISVLNTDSEKYESVIMFPKLYYLPKLAWAKNQVYSYFIIEQATANPFIYYLYGDVRIPTSLKNIYDSYTEETVKRIGAAGVKYILVHRDFSYIDVRHDFENDPSVDIVVNGPNVSLFKVKDEFLKPLIYSEPQTNINFARLAPYKFFVTAQAPVSSLILNREFDKNWVLITKNSMEKSGYSQCVEKVKFNNLCHFLLLNRNIVKTPASEQDHINSWPLENGNSSEFYLFFLPQAYMSMGIIISAITLIIIVVTGTISYIHAKYSKSATNLQI